MSDGYSEADLHLFSDLERAAAAVGVRPCLIGAGAIQLGATLDWAVRLDRATVDWDFAVRMDSWGDYEKLSEYLTGAEGGFERAKEPHRFWHKDGGTLDLLPYGPVEDPAGSITWGNGMVMDTAGFSVLEKHHESVHIPSCEFRIASLPALVGLKLLAYRDRRPGTTHDIGDVDSILQAAEESVQDERIDARAEERLHSDEVLYSNIGSYLLGRDIGCVFPEAILEQLRTTLREAESLDPMIVHDILRVGAGFEPEADVIRRLRALGIGLGDS